METVCLEKWTHSPSVSVLLGMVHGYLAPNVDPLIERAALAVKAVALILVYRAGQPLLVPLLLYLYNM